MQPASFTDPYPVADEPDDLPTSCKECDAQLQGWQVEINVYSRNDVEVIWITSCFECGSIVTKTV